MLLGAGYMPNCNINTDASNMSRKARTGRPMPLSISLSWLARRLVPSALSYAAYTSLGSPSATSAAHAELRSPCGDQGIGQGFKSKFNASCSVSCRTRFRCRATAEM